MATSSMKDLAMKKPNGNQIRRMSELAHHRMSHGGARLLDELEDVLALTKEIMEAGRERGKREDEGPACQVCKRKPDTGFRLALDAAMVNIKNLDTCARILGEVQDRQQVHIVHLAESPEWNRIRKTIAAALVPYPDAARAVAAALRAGGSGYGADDVQDAEIVETPPPQATGVTHTAGFAGQR